MYSIFTNDLNVCMFIGECTRGKKRCEGGRCYDIERHHIFGGFNKKRSEKYGYIAPLTRTLHPNGIYAPSNWQEIDLYLKQECQKDFEKTHTREEFIEEFGRSWL